MKQTNDSNSDRDDRLLLMLQGGAEIALVLQTLDGRDRYKIVLPPEEATTLGASLTILAQHAKMLAAGDRPPAPPIMAHRQPPGPRIEPQPLYSLRQTGSKETN